MDIQSGQFNLDYARMLQLNQQAQSLRANSANNKDNNAQVLSTTGQGIEGYRHPKTAEERKMRDTANDFESVFVKQMLDAMEQTVDREDSLFGSNDSESYFRDMMHAEMAKQMSGRPGGSNFGLAESIYRELAKSQPVAQETTKINSGETLKMGDPD
ncbi:MAG: rod-binding protein [Vampirovibrionales bacterium]|nr:rod-binding protein [Vampirovibrionales bacterium]